LTAFKTVQQQFPAAVMILAPRHPERFEKVAGEISAVGFAVQRRSVWQSPQPIRSGIFLLDSVGELAAVYELADIAFVGGSLVATGGHNILEPAQYGAAILVGPHTFNFREIVNIFEQGSAVKIVTAETLGGQLLSLLSHPDESTLGGQLLSLLSHPDERQPMGSAAKELFAKHAGATRRTLEALASLFKQQERAK